MAFADQPPTMEDSRSTMNTQARVSKILNALAHSEEDLLALSDDIWINIDHNDSDALDAGIAFKKKYNHAMLAFTQAADQLRELIRQSEPESLVSVPIFEDTDRVVRSLDTAVQHRLDEDFRYKRPIAFVFENKTYEGLATWKDIYITFLQLMESLQPDFHQIVDSEDVISARNNSYITEDETLLRSAAQITPTIFAEVNLSANGIRDMIIRVLVYFGYRLDTMGIFLREDRDAE